MFLTFHYKVTIELSAPQATTSVKKRAEAMSATETLAQRRTTWLRACPRQFVKICASPCRTKQRRRFYRDSANAPLQKRALLSLDTLVLPRLLLPKMCPHFAISLPSTCGSSKLGLAIPLCGQNSHGPRFRQIQTCASDYFLANLINGMLRGDSRENRS